MNRVNQVLQTGEAWSRGITGKGIGCAIFDTGIFPHEDLKGRVIAGPDFINNRQMPYDDNGHGTEIAGIAAGDGRLSGQAYRGIAPEAKVISLKILNKNGNGSMDHVMAGIEWVLKHRYVYGIRVVNLSVGTSADEEDEEERALLKSVERLWDEGIVVVAAAGNQGPKDRSVTVPGNCPKIITVGAMKTSMNRYDRSGCGPTDLCIVKPEILAPGYAIVSCGPGNRYQTKSGTSMSAAIVTGCVALLLQKEPWLTPKEVKKRFYYSADNLGLPKNQQGWGTLNLKRLLRIT